MPGLLSYLIGFIALVFLGIVALDIMGFVSKKPSNTYQGKGFNPKTLLIVPCKGIDFQLYENLISLKNQDYRNFNIVAVIDSERDESLNIIKKAKINYILSSSVCQKCSGKVKAIVTAIEHFKDYKIYAIADSDIRVKKDWLKTLVLPLSDKNVGLSTKYPYFNHLSGFWSKVKSIWGMVGEGMMTREVTVFGWGGSLAFRRDLLDKQSFNYLKNSEYSVSDDICLTHITKNKGLTISYSDQAQPIVNSKDSNKDFWEWANRQTALSILGNRKNFYLGVSFYFGETLLILSGISFSILISPIFLLLLLHYLKNSIITYKRSKQKYLLIFPIMLIMPFIYLTNLLTANRMQSIEWRGSRYNLRQE